MLVAAQLWSEKGYAAVGIREISRAVHLTPGALYHYMGTKEELLQRIMQQTIAPLVQSAGAVLSSDGSILSRLDALVALHVRAHATDQLHTRITDLEYRSLTGESQRAMALLRQEYEAVWRTLIRQGAAAGTFHVPDDDVTTIVLLEMCTGVAHWYNPAGRLDVQSVVAIHQELSRRLLGAPPH